MIQKITLEDYRNLLQTIWTMMNEYHMQYGVAPNLVNVGYNELTVLKMSDNFLQENGYKVERSLWTIFGMSLKEVYEENYLAVGCVYRRE